MTEAKRISRRQALARIGLVGVTAYVAPAVLGLSTARASSGPTEPSPPSAPSGPDDRDFSRSGPSGPGACSLPQPDGPAQISRQEYRRAQRAILRGEARPLRDVLDEVLQAHPGRLVQVGYSDSGSTPLYRLQIVRVGGVMLAIAAEAATGQIVSVRTC
jgi:hypothetical protein